MKTTIRVWHLLVVYLLALGVLLFAAYDALADPPPVPAGQPHQDIFESTSGTELQQFNPLTERARQDREITYRLLLVSGCSAGSIPADLEALSVHVEEAIGLVFTRNDSNYDFTIRINCGNEHIRVCGSINVFCLGRGFPFVVDVDISDVLSQWPFATRLSILAHEAIGHAIATWMEQYCLGQARGDYDSGHPCFNLARFTSAPGWRDFMNTGPLSRQGFEENTLGRWERTMWEFEEEGPWGECSADLRVCFHRPAGSWVAASGNVYVLRLGRWFLHREQALTSWGGYYLPEISRWVASDGAVYDSAAQRWDIHPWVKENR